jgi:hypothetical protein
VVEAERMVGGMRKEVTVPGSHRAPVTDTMGRRRIGPTSCDWLFYETPGNLGGVEQAFSDAEEAAEVCPGVSELRPHRVHRDSQNRRALSV